MLSVGPLSRTVDASFANHEFRERYLILVPPVSDNATEINNNNAIVLVP